MSNYLETLTDMLTAIAPELDVEEITVFEDDLCWIIAFDEEGAFGISVNALPEDGLLHLMATIEPPEIAEDAATQRALLVFNSAWAANGGLYTAIDPEEGDVILNRSLSLERLTTETLGTAIGALYTAAGVLHAQLHNRPAGQGREDDAGGTSPKQHWV